MEGVKATEPAAGEERGEKLFFKSGLGFLYTRLLRQAGVDNSVSVRMDFTLSHVSECGKLLPAPSLRKASMWCYGVCFK